MLACSLACCLACLLACWLAGWCNLYSHVVVLEPVAVIPGEILRILGVSRGGPGGVPGGPGEGPRGVLAGP